MTDYNITVAGHKEPLTFLLQAYQQNQLMPVYLFWGENNVGKSTAALWLAQQINCLAPVKQRACGQCRSCRKIYETLYPDLNINAKLQPDVKSTSKINPDTRANVRIHPDIKIITPESHEILIEQIRALQEEAKLLPLEAALKFYIIEDAHRLNNYAANCLLKILEEPPSQVMIILITDSPAYLLPTILSRCAMIKFSLLPNEQVREFIARHTNDEPKIELLVKLAQGKPGKALQILQNPNFANTRTAILKLLNSFKQITLTEFIEKGEKLELDKPENLEILISWVTDLLRIKENLKTDYLVNYDYTPDLTRLADELTIWQCYQIGLMIKEFRFDLEKPFNLNKKHLVWQMLTSVNSVFEIKEI
jgi:DNA polymerase III subunit delta'